MYFTEAHFMYFTETYFMCFICCTETCFAETVEIDGGVVRSEDEEEDLSGSTSDSQNSVVDMRASSANQRAVWSPTSGQLQTLVVNKVVCRR